jgi:FixJ family two-component response regulator
MGPPSRAPGDGARWVAVVDDDSSIRLSLARVFRGAGIHAQTFASAEEYLAHEMVVGPRCLVLDVHLGGELSGFDLHAHLVSAGEAPPVIFITAHDDAPRHACRGGSYAYLHKPFDPEALLALVRVHLADGPGA